MHAILLGGCNAGEGPNETQYLKQMVGATGVPVTGAHDPQHPGKPGYEGPTTTCYPGEHPTTKSRARPMIPSSR